MDYVGDAIFRYKYQRITNLYLSENKKKWYYYDVWKVHLKISSTVKGTDSKRSYI
jgi:hypothetical protein